MTLYEYQECLNQLGYAGWVLAGARRMADTPLSTVGVDEAFELARLALHQLIHKAQVQAEQTYGRAAFEALGDPGACMDQQERMLETDGPAPYWKIAGPW